MERITSINEIADFVRAEGIKARNDAGNISGLYLILSMRWHWEITKILKDKRYDFRDIFWHIEPGLAKAYWDMKKLFNSFPDKAPEEVKHYFSWVWPGYSPIIMNMFYELAQYEKSKNA